MLEHTLSLSCVFDSVVTTLGIEPTESTDACVIPSVVPVFFWPENLEIPLLLDSRVADCPPTDPTEREDVERDDLPGNTRGTFAIAPCAVFLSGTLGREARVVFADWGLGFGLVDALTDLEVTFFTDLERSLEFEEEEEDADEVRKRKRKMRMR